MEEEPMARQKRRWTVVVAAMLTVVLVASTVRVAAAEVTFRIMRRIPRSTVPTVAALRCPISRMKKAKGAKQRNSSSKASAKAVIAPQSESESG